MFESCIIFAFCFPLDKAELVSSVYNVWPFFTSLSTKFLSLTIIESHNFPLICFFSLIFECFCISHSFLNFSALPKSKNLLITGFGHNQDSSSFNIGNVHHSMWKFPNLLVHLIDLSQVFLRTFGTFCCASIVDITHSGRHCYWQENWFNMKLLCYTPRTWQTKRANFTWRLNSFYQNFELP
mgnify:CR=1 FL=1